MKSKINFLIYLMITLLVAGCKKDKVVEMKSEIELHATWDNLGKKIDENPELWEHVKRVFNRNLQTNLPSSKEVALRQLYRVLRDPNETASAAVEALRFFVSADAKEVVRESLLNPRDDTSGWGLVITASIAIGDEANKRVKDKAALPYLIHVLKKNNYPQPGSEAAGVHRRMKRELVEAIKQITNLDIKTSEINVNDTEQVERVLSLARGWAKQNRIKLFEENKKDNK